MTVDQSKQKQLLHWVFKITDLSANVQFFKNILGMRILRHEEFESGCEAECNGKYSRPWSKTMIGYGSEENHFVFELTYNYGIRSYKQGNDLHAIILNGRQAIHDNCIKHNYPFIVENNNLILKSPDNYTFFIQEGDLNVMGIEINVNHLDKSLDYYVDVLGMSITSQSTHSATVQFSKFHTYLVLREKKEVIEFGESSGRLAIGVSLEELDNINKKVIESDDIIHIPRVSLPTPGKATVEVIILKDRDGFEICCVGMDAFLELAKPFDGCDYIDWSRRIDMGTREIPPQ